MGIMIAVCAHRTVFCYVFDVFINFAIASVGKIPFHPKFNRITLILNFIIK